MHSLEVLFTQTDRPSLNPPVLYKRSWIPSPTDPPRPTHPEEKVQSLAAVEAIAEGDEDSSVGSPHSRPGWAG